MTERPRKKFKWPGVSIITPKGWSYIQKQYHLTPRELQTAIAVCRGCDNRQIAEKLEVELNTAKVYLAGVYKRVGVSSKSMLVITLMRGASKAKAASFANPVVFFVNDTQQEIIENAISLVGECGAKMTKGAKRATGLMTIARYFLDNSQINSGS